MGTQRLMQLAPLLGWWLLGISCAQIRGLEGGARDTRPPELLSADPPHLTRRFASQTIVFSFDEYVQVNNLAQELVVSPPFSGQPAALVRKKTVELVIPDSLLPNTTYVFQFGNGITDFTEGNQAELVYVVSTGDVIDSLEVRGQAFDAWTGKPAEGARIMLYPESSPASVLAGMPRYVARADKEGRFVLSYLAPGSYYLVGIKESTENYLADLGESVGFLSRTVAAADSSVQHDLFLSLPPAGVEVIESFRADSTGRLCLAWPDDTVQLQLLQDGFSEPINGFRMPTSDSIVFFLKGAARDRMEAVAIRRDTLILDTLYMPFYRKPGARAMRAGLEGGNRLRPHDPLFISYPAPIDSIVADRAVMVLPDSSEIRVQLSRGRAPWEARIDHPPLPPGKIRLRVEPGAVTSIHGAPSDTLDLEMAVAGPRDLGVMGLEISGVTSGRLMLHITDPKGKVVLSAPQDVPGRMVLRDLFPGDFEIRLYEDVNGNGRWDSGDFFNGLQPERVWVYPDKMTIRANWELNQKWVLE